MTKKEIQMLFQWMVEALRDSKYGRIALEFVIADGEIRRVERTVKTSTFSGEFVNEEK